jgi:para-nitrobenzyl esterase
MRTVAITALVLTAACGRWSQPPAHAMVASLEGTSWRLVKFVGGDGKALEPDDRSRYTVAFGTRSDVRVRFDCNQGRGTWHATPPRWIELRPLALTRAACPPGSLHDQLARQWQSIQSYHVSLGHLFLSMPEGGVYEFEPLTP